jgi:hypothetical protein
MKPRPSACPQHLRRFLPAEQTAPRLLLPAEQTAPRLLLPAEQTAKRLRRPECVEHEVVLLDVMSSLQNTQVQFAIFITPYETHYSKIT